MTRLAAIAWARLRRWCYLTFTAKGFFDCASDYYENDRLYKLTSEPCGMYGAGPVTPRVWWREGE